MSSISAMSWPLCTRAMSWPFCTRPTRLVGFFHSARPPKQQSMGKDVAPLGHIILILIKPVFLLLLLQCAHLVKKQQISLL